MGNSQAACPHVLHFSAVFSLLVSVTCQELAREVAYINAQFDILITSRKAEAKRTVPGSCPFVFTAEDLKQLAYRMLHLQPMAQLDVGGDGVSIAPALFMNVQVPRFDQFGDDTLHHAFRDSNGQGDIA